MITIRETSTKSSGVMIKSSHMLLADLDIQCLVKSQLKESLVLREHQLTLVINSSHLSRHLIWHQIPHLVSNLVRQFMRTIELLNGLDSGRQPSHLLLVLHQAFMSSKPMQLMVCHLFLGKQKTSRVSRFHSNSRMDQVQVLKVFVTVMTTTI